MQLSPMHQRAQRQRTCPIVGPDQNRPNPVLERSSPDCRERGSEYILDCKMPFVFRVHHLGHNWWPFGYQSHWQFALSECPVAYLQAFPFDKNTNRSSRLDIFLASGCGPERKDAKEERCPYKNLRDPAWCSLLPAKIPCRVLK